MKFTNKFTRFVTFLVYFGSVSQFLSQDFKSKYSIILVIDGPRYSETFGDTSCKYIPKMGKELIKEGVFFENFKNNGPTYTVPGHVAMTTGIYQRISNGGTSFPRSPSIFQYYLKASNSPKSDAYVVASKGKLDVLVNTKTKKWKNQYIGSTYCGPNGLGIGYGSDEKTFSKVMELVSGNNPPHLMLINLLAVDVYGHANMWNKYLESIKVCDNYADSLWKVIQSNPILKDKTTLFITNDHGRHLDGKKTGFISHGDNCSGCRHISLLVLGPDVNKGKRVKKEAELIDISKTISKMMSFDMPTSNGRFLEELFSTEK
jgi:predicted AlkP superfamily pyrophosphatase or phosphodiesterase